MSNKTPPLTARSASAMLQQKPLAGVVSIVALALIQFFAQVYGLEIPAVDIPGAGPIPLDILVSGALAGIVMWLVPPKAGETVVTDRRGQKYEMLPVIESDDATPSDKG